MVEEGDLFNMEMEILEEARKGLRAPSPLEKAPSPMPGVEETTCTPVPDPLPTSKPEEAESPEELALVVLRRWPSQPPRFAPLGMDNSEMLPLEDAYGTVASPIGSMLDLTTMASLQMTVLHMPATDEVHYLFQAWSISRISLLSASL